jgi:flagellin-like protein
MKGGHPMPSVMMKKLGRDQQGITGLETAIILIAFVVVASVFAYTVLSAGIFSSEKGKEAVHAGLEQARGSMELVGSVKATSIAATAIDTLDAPGNWTASTNVTIGTDTSDYKEGTGSMDLTIGAAFTTGLAVYEDGGAINLTSPQHYSLQLWVKSSLGTSAGDYEIVLDDSTGCGSALETIDLPALTAATWQQVVIDLATPTADSAIVCWGVNVAVDDGGQVLTIDDLKAPKEVTSISFVVANALDGEPINLTTTTDADSDGLLSDESTKNHVLTVIYADEDQRTTDVKWTRTELGKGDGDALLEPGEKMQITVSTIAANPMPVADTSFNLTLVREQGADMVIERTLPSVLGTEMDLN